MANTNTMIGLRPRKRYRVRAAHAKNATMIDRTIEMAVTTTLFLRLVRNEVWVTATMKLSNERCMGQNTGVVVMISSRGFTAVIIIQ